MTDFSKNRAKALAVCERYEAYMGGNIPEAYDRTNLLMDVLAADGVNGNQPLDWGKLLAFDNFNFMHDIVGISEHMNRSTGKIEGFFLPRCATNETEA